MRWLWKSSGGDGIDKCRHRLHATARQPIHDLHEAVLAALREERADWRDLSAEDLAETIRRASKQRHELVGGRIRALYGHSLPGKLRRTLARFPVRWTSGSP